MKPTFKISVLLTFILLIFAGSTFAADDFALSGNIQTQGDKKLYEGPSDEVLDAFWFRANFGGKYTSEDFEGQVMIRMFAPVSSNKKDSDGKASDYFSADIYWGSYKWKYSRHDFYFKLGHWKTDWSVSGNFGTYVDKALGSRGFMMRDYVHDAFEFGWKTGLSSLQLMVATTDASRKFSTGYIRVEENLKFTVPLEMNLAYRINAIDPLVNTAVLTQRGALKLSYQFIPQLKIYAEGGFVITGEDEDVNTASNKVTPEYKQDSKYFPMYIGFDVPILTLGFLDNLFFELEYIKDREEFKNDSSDELAWTVGATKKFGKRMKAQLNFYSEKELNDAAVSLRLTTTIK